VPTLKQKQDGNFIVHKNTDSVPGAPPVSTFQVDPIAVQILARSGVTDGEFLDGDTFWSLYDVGLLETKNEAYDPTVPKDANVGDLTALEGFDVVEQATFLSELLDSQPIDEIADSEPVLKIAANVDRVLADPDSEAVERDEIADILWDAVEATLSPTPFAADTLVRVGEILSLDPVETPLSEFGGTLIWSLFLNQFYRGLEDPDAIVADLDASPKATVHFQFDGFAVATTSETWYYVGPTSGVAATSEQLQRRVSDSHDMHPVFLDDIPPLCLAQLEHWFPGTAPHAVSFSKVLATGFAETIGYLIVLPGTESLSVPEISISSGSGDDR
jgi:hypothetical protein